MKWSFEFAGGMLLILLIYVVLLGTPILILSIYESKKLSKKENNIIPTQHFYDRFFKVK